MTLRTRYSELQSAGRVPLYGDGLTIVSPARRSKRLMQGTGTAFH
jgi:hypothetical protein